MFANKKAHARWPHLPPKDAEICAAYEASQSQNKNYRILAKAINEKNYGLLRAVLSLPYFRECFVKAVHLCVDKRDIEAIEILSQRATDLKGTEATSIFDKIKQSPWPEGLPFVVRLSSSMNAHSLTELIALIEPGELRKKCFSQVYQSRPDDIIRFLTEAGQYPASVFADALAALQGGGDKVDIKGKVLEKLIGKEGASVSAQVDLLFKHNINVNHDSGSLMTTALLGGQTLRAEMLLEAGFNMSLWGKAVLENLYSKGAPPESIAWLEEKIGRAEVKLSEDYHLSPPDTVSRVIPLPAGGRLTMLFNFALRQQILVQEGTGTQPTAPAAIPFAEIENPQALEDARAAFIRLGGDPATAQDTGRKSLPIERKVKHVRAS